MILKKTKLSYFFWALYLIIFMATLLVSSYLIATNIYGNDDVFTIGYIGCISVLIGLVLTFVAKRLDFSKTGDTFMEMSHFTEVVLVAIIIIFAFMLRFIYLTIIGNAVIAGGINLVNFNKDTAALTAHPSVYFYEESLNWLKEGFGNSYLAQNYFEALLQFIMNLLIYLSVRFFMGKTPAFMAAVLYGMLPYNIEKLTNADSSSFLAVIFMFAFMFVVTCAYMHSFDKLVGLNGVLSVIITGALSGFAAYCDRVGLSLLLFGVLAFIINKRISEPGKKEESIKLKTILISFIIGFFAAFLGGALLMSYSAKIPFGTVLSGYFDGFNNINKDFLVSSPAPGNISSVILICLSSIWILRIFSIERDHGSYMVVINIIIFIFSFLGYGRDEYDMLSTVLWVMFAGMGFASIGSNNLEKAIRDKEARARAREEEKKRAEELHLEFLEKEKAELQEKAKINEEAKRRDKEKVMKLLNEKPGAKQNNENAPAEKENNENKISEKNEKKNIKDMFGRKKDINFKQEKEPELSLEELEAELDFLHMGVSDDEKDAEKENKEENLKNNTESGKDKSAKEEQAEKTTGEKSLEEILNAPIVKSNSAAFDNVLKAKENASEDKNETNVDFESMEKADNADKTENADNTEKSDNTEKTISDAVLEAEKIAADVKAKKEEKEQETKEPELSENGKPIVRMNPGISRFGRRMDYRTAVVKDGQTSSDDKPQFAVISEENSDAKTDDTEVETENTDVKTDNAEAKPENNYTGSENAETKIVKHEDLLAQLSESETDKDTGNAGDVKKEEINYIKNPLPQPKKHIPKQLEYDLEISEDQMHFDLLELGDNDKFDIN